MTNAKGGKGAVREAVEFILDAKGVWKEVLEKDIKRQKSELM